MVRRLGTPRQTLRKPRPLQRCIRSKQHHANNPQPDILLLTNGTYSDTTKSQASKDLPDWAQRLALYNITVEDRIIANFSRVIGNDSDYNDDFRITFTDEGSIVRNAIKGAFPAELASDLPMKLGLKLSNESDATV